MDNYLIERLKQICMVNSTAKVMEEIARIKEMEGIGQFDVHMHTHIIGKKQTNARMTKAINYVKYKLLIMQSFVIF